MMHSENMCRVCLSESNELTPLRVKVPGADKTLEETINFIVNINIVLERGLPDKICNNCETALEVADSFKQRVLESEEILRQLDKRKGTDESRSSFENKGLENSEIYSDDASRLPTAVSCPPLPNSLEEIIKKEKNVYDLLEYKIKVEIEENFVPDELSSEQEKLDKIHNSDTSPSKSKQLCIIEECPNKPVNKTDTAEVMSTTEDQEATKSSTTIETRLESKKDEVTAVIGKKKCAEKEVLSNSEEEIDVVSLDVETQKPLNDPYVRLSRSPLIQDRYKQQSLTHGMTLRPGRKLLVTPPIDTSSGRRRRSCKVKRYNTEDSDGESPEIIHRSIHNDMERQRRIGLNNLFDVLKELIPVTKENAPKVLILREATTLCRKLREEEIERENLEKQKKKLVAKLKRLRRMASKRYRPH